MPRATRAEPRQALARAGLTTPAAEEILARHGPNQLPAAHRPHLVTQLGVALALRAPRVNGFWRDRGLELAVLAAGACQLAGVMVPALRDLLGTEPLDAQAIVLLLAAAAIPGLFVAAGRRLARRRGSGLEPPPSASQTEAPSRKVEVAT